MNADKLNSVGRIQVLKMSDLLILKKKVKNIGKYPI